MLADDELRRQAEARVGMVVEGKWRLDALLGVGGMASVYAATHRNTKRVAVKMLHPHLSFDGSIRERFLREGYAANRVKHPGVVAVHDENTTADGTAFLVMELLDGESVGQRWQRRGYRLPPEEVLSLTEQLLDTLAAAHEQGIVHRDIKPENLFITEEGPLKVLDFGIARLRELSGSISATRTGSMLGTPAFMAPEQAKGHWSEVDEWTDLWAVGATMFTLLTGEYVHQGNTPNEMLALTITQPARSIAPLLPGLHPALVELVDRSLAYRKQDRWPDARAMLKALSLARSEMERSGGAFTGSVVAATTNFDAALSPRPQRGSASPDAATLPSAEFRPAPTPSASTTAQAEAITGRGIRRRIALAGSAAALVVGGVVWALLPSSPVPAPAPASDLAHPESVSTTKNATPSTPTAEPVSVFVQDDASIDGGDDASVVRKPAPSVAFPVVAPPPRAPRKPPDASKPTTKPSGDPFARRR